MSPSKSSLDLSETILTKASPNLVGELLRELTFPGDGFGCYTTFEVREDARKWSRNQKATWWIWFGYDDEAEDDFDYAQAGDGYSYEIGGFHIDVCWFWDGDGVLTFCISDAEKNILRRLSNNDCKKDYRWEDEDVG